MQATSAIIPCVFSLLLRMNAPTAYNIEHLRPLQKKPALLNSLPSDIIHKIFACADLTTKKTLRCTCSTLHSLDIKNTLSHSPLIISRKDHIKYMVYAAQHDDVITFTNLLLNTFHNKYRDGYYNYSNIYDMIQCFLSKNCDEAMLVGMYYKKPNPAILKELLPCLMAIYRGEKEHINNYVIKNTRWPQCANIPLIYIAARNAHLDVIELLLHSHSAHVDEQVFGGYSALHLAAYHNLPSVAECLVENGANVNITDNRGCTPLLLACYEGATEIVALLVAHKADTTIGGKRDKPLHGAIINRHIPIVRMLIEYGVDVNEKYNGQTPLIMAVDQQPYDVYYDICELLLKKGANIDEVDSHGFTALMLAAEWGYLPFVELLLSYNANINHQSQRHETALSLALKAKYKPIIKLLLKQPNIQINAKEQKLLLRLKNHKKKKINQSETS